CAVDPPRVDIPDGNRARLDGSRPARARTTDPRQRGSRSAGPGGNLPGAASMKAVGRLLLTYAFGTPLLRIFSVVGLVILLASVPMLEFLAQSDVLLSI